MPGELSFRSWVRTGVVFDEYGATVWYEAIGYYQREAWRLGREPMEPHLSLPKWKRWLRRHRIGIWGGKAVGVSFIWFNRHGQRRVCH